MKQLRIYLSSTFEDLNEYRGAVFSALEKAGLAVARMEGYTAADERPLGPLTVCLYYRNLVDGDSRLTPDHYVAISPRHLRGSPLSPDFLNAVRR